MANRYKRILLKLSGESLMGNKSYGIDNERLNLYADEIVAIAKSGVQVAVVIGGGNIYRGMQAEGRYRSGARRSHGYAGHRDQQPGLAERAWRPRAQDPPAHAPSRWSRSPSRSSAAGLCATWRKVGS
jgi:hypothetical protein